MNPFYRKRSLFMARKRNVKKSVTRPFRHRNSPTQPLCILKIFYNSVTIVLYHKTQTKAAIFSGISHLSYAECMNHIIRKQLFMMQCNINGAVFCCSFRPIFTTFHLQTIIKKITVIERTFFVYYLIPMK